MIFSITTAIYPPLSRLAIESTIQFKVQRTKTISTWAIGIFFIYGDPMPTENDGEKTNAAEHKFNISKLFNFYVIFVILGDSLGVFSSAKGIELGATISI